MLMRFLSRIRHSGHSGASPVGTRSLRLLPHVEAFAAGAFLLAIVASGCATPVVIPVETPMPATLDVSPFARVMVAGFIGAGSDDIDASVETTRLLRSQLRRQPALKLVEAADALPLLELAAQGGAHPGAFAVTPASWNTAAGQAPKIPKNEAELKTCEQIFSNVAFWKRIGEEYQQPLIITGTVLFTVEARRGLVAQEREVFDAAGRRRLESRRAFVERTVFTLKPRFIFIDGRSGTILESESTRESLSTSESQNVPALSAYFQLMDRIVPTVIGTFSDHRVRGARALLQ